MEHTGGQKGTHTKVVKRFLTKRQRQVNGEESFSQTDMGTTGQTDETQLTPLHKK